MPPTLGRFIFHRRCKDGLLLISLARYFAETMRLMAANKF
jgi:hypothetical protein